MAQPNYSLIRYQADNIPHFDGNSKLINRFISACENFLNAHRDRNNPNAAINIALFDTILSKLVGRAADLIASRLELNSWDLIKSAIIDTFSDQRSVDCIIQDIITMKPDRNENSQQFGLRLQDARSLLFSKVNSFNDLREIKLLKINEYGNLVTKTFINGLNYHMQLIVRLKNPQSLEEAITHAIEEENFIYFKNRQNSTHKINTNTHNTLNQHNKPNNFRPPNNTTLYCPPQPQGLFPTFQQNTNIRPTMPQYPIPPRNNLQFTGFGQFKNNSNPSRQTRIFNNQNFQNRPMTNQFRSNNPQNNRQFDKVEPMDVSSGNTITKQTPRQQNQPQNRKYVTQELFNQSVTNLSNNLEQSNQYENYFEPETYTTYPQNEQNTDYDNQFNQYPQFLYQNNEFDQTEQNENFDDQFSPNFQNGPPTNTPT